MAEESRTRAKPGLFGWITSLCITGVALALLWMAVGGDVLRPVSRTTVCAANLKAIASACLIYAKANRGQFPARLQLLTAGGPKSLLQPKQILCPESKEPYVLVPPARRSDPRDVLVYEAGGRNHRSDSGGNVAYMDGHVAWRSPEQLQLDLKLTSQRRGDTRPLHGGR